MITKRMFTLIALWLVAGVLLFPGIGGAQDPPAGDPPAGNPPAEAPPANEPSPELTDLLARLHHPVRAGLRDISFVFRHQAFENSAIPFRGTRFAYFYKAPDHWKLEVRNLHESHALMADRLVELMSWIRLFTGSVMMLDAGLTPEGVVSITKEGSFTKVITRPGEKEIPLTLRFREEDGKIYLHGVQSQKYGTLRLGWEKVEGSELELVTYIEISDPKTALGTWTLRCEDLRVNLGIEDSVFEKD